VPVIAATPGGPGGDRVPVNLNETHWRSLVAEERRRSFGLRRFNPYLEQEFRQHYARVNHPRVRPILMLAALLIIVMTGVGMVAHDLSAVTATFGLAVMMPLLMATLIASYQPERTMVYQCALAASALCIGLLLTSVTLRASMHGMPYYFAAEVAWISVVWLILGLLIWYAASVALVLTVAYCWGLVHWNFDMHQLGFDMFMLGGMNLLCAMCCVQLESISRRSFLESRFLGELAERDGLTGLYNRRAYNDYIDRIWRQSRREQSQLMILLIDIDHFKLYNDVYGHQAGDDALKRVGQVIAMGAQRPLDFAARYGGEEFALVLYAPASDFGQDLPEQIRQQVQEMHIQHAQAPAGVLTVSIGVAIVTPGAERSLAGAIQMADEALYQAKEEGRNRVVVKEARHTHIQTGRFRAGRKAV
jgi:diguanylate cyclase (GGDEF)-like protein